MSQKNFNRSRNESQEKEKRPKLSKKNEKIKTIDLGLHKDKSKYKSEKNKKNEIQIPIIDDSDSLDSSTISEFLIEVKQKLINEEITLEEYIKINDIDDQLIKAYLNELISNKDFLKFYSKYEYFQYRLKLSDRIEIQKLFLMNKDIPELILMNLLNGNAISIKLLFIEIYSNIIKLENISYDKISKVFTDKNVFFDKPIDTMVPNKYGTNEFQFFSLLSDTYYYFQDTEGDKINLKEKFNKFVALKYLINRMNNLDEKQLISNTNLLINMLYIYKEKGTMNYYLFDLIIKTCTPFDAEVANESLNLLKSYKLELYINGLYFKSYNNKINENDIISFTIGKKSTINIKAKYFNWDIKENIIYTLDTNSDYFMLSIKYPENTKYNFYTLNDKIKSSVSELFVKIIKSPSAKQAMLVDGELADYRYLFSNDKIIEECENNVHLVYFPFTNYNGYIDKKSYDIYINISIKRENPLINILTEFKKFLVTKCHEFKHASRIYMKLYKNININTPNIKLNDFKGDKNYIVKINENSIKTIVNSSVNYNKNSKIFKKSMKEYREFFEYAIFGYKLDSVFLYNVILFLNENTWDLSPQEFYNEYDKVMKDTKSKSIELLCKEGLPNLIYTYFSPNNDSKYYNNLIIDKNNSFLMNNGNILISIPRASHRPKFIKNKDDLKEDED